MADVMTEMYRATTEAFADPKPGDRFQEMYSWWVVVIEAGPGGVKVMAGSGPTNITRGRFPDGEIVEPFPERAEVRWYATADDFRAAYAVKTMPGHYSVMLADRGKVDVAGWLERAKEVPAAPTHPKPQPDALKLRPGDQRLPVPNDGPSMHDLVIEDLDHWPVKPVVRDAIRGLLAARKRLGLERYGSLLQAGNGRDWLQDLREECADALVYARQGLEELGPGPEYADVFRAYQRIVSALVHLQEIPGGSS